MNCAFRFLLPLFLATAQQRGAEQLGPLPILDARDMSAEGSAFVELSSPRPMGFVHERIPVRLRFGIEREFLREHLVQLFQRQLDIPVQVWLDLPESSTEAGPENGLSFAFGELLTRAVPTEERRVDGRTFTVLEVERMFTPEAAGERIVPAPRLRFAHATRFDEDFVNGRVAVDRQAAFVQGAPLVLTIQPLPEQGRPREFAGAVGRFTVRAETDGHELEVGQHFAVRLRIEGEGDSASIAPPDLADLPGLRVFGMLANVDDNPGAFTYDLVALDEHVRAVPSIAFAFFDPNPPAGYRTAHTLPLPLVVRPAASSAARGLSPLLRAGILLLPLCLGLCVMLWLRARRRAPDA